MGRRTLTPATPVPTGPPPVLPHDLPQLAQSDPSWAANLQLLRRQWKWAAFSQFFYTFAPLFGMSDVTLMDIEDDLARNTSLYLPRVIQRLLYTLTQDRKITIDTWQSGLRKHYMRRNPEANPLGPEPKPPTRESTRELSDLPPSDINEGTVDETTGDAAPVASGSVADGEMEKADEDASNKNHDEGGSQPKKEPSDEPSFKRDDTDGVKQEEDEESKDWMELPILVKLDSLHLLIEWQFQTPHRLRSIMKDDDEGANWRIEPIGYDAKTNAYWLIGPDRLWLQRVPPKPSKSGKRKRAPNKKSDAHASTSKADEEEYESEPQASPKRKRVQPQTPISRPSRRKTKEAATPVLEQTPGSRSTRAAKSQANKKLDVQAKELAEFQRQAAQLTAASKAHTRSTRQTRSQADASPSKSPKRPTLGTRASARLRGAESKDDDDDDEWQQIPDEWLQDNPSSPPAPSPSKEVKGKGKAKAAEEDSDPDALDLAELKTGLESDRAASELTELSEEMEPDNLQDGLPDEPVAEEQDERAQTRRTRSSRLTAAAKGLTSSQQKEEQDSTENPPVEEVSQIPEDFIEWEAICVTLSEWEHIAARFEKSSHYLEKALYRMLTHHIVPAVTAELKEAERKQKLEEAIVHRKRSSRIAIKESEKEEARLAARKKAEENEKLARAKRLEARVKRDDADREKREKAREQRRVEREEREQRAREKQERAERRARAAEEDRSSTTTPARLGTHSTGSIELSTVPTPTGIQTPNWMLDCEICHKRGVNLDDGMPMVCCGICNKWQHIRCHDYADQQAGRPRRNWDVQHFYCTSCRTKHSNGALYGGQNHQRYPQQQQQYPSSSWPQSIPDPAMHPPKGTSSSYSRDLYPQPTSDIRFMPQHAPSGMAYSQAPPTAYTRTQGGLTFSHYQPEQRAFTSRRSTLPQPVPQPPQWSNGYPTEHTQSRTPPVQYAPQYPQHGASYPSGRMPTTYQQHTPPIPQHQSYGAAPEVPVSVPNGQWSGGSNGYFPPSDSAVRTAAESLAYLQSPPNGQHQHQQNGWHHPAPSSPPPLVPTNGGLHGEHSYPVPVFPEQGGGSSYPYPS